MQPSEKCNVQWGFFCCLTPYDADVDRHYLCMKCYFHLCTPGTAVCCSRFELGGRTAHFSAVSIYHGHSLTTAICISISHHPSANVRHTRIRFLLSSLFKNQRLTRIYGLTCHFNVIIMDKCNPSKIENYLVQQSRADKVDLERATSSWSNTHVGGQNTFLSWGSGKIFPTEPVRAYLKIKILLEEAASTLWCWR